MSSIDKNFSKFEKFCRSFEHEFKSRAITRDPIYIFGAGKFGKTLLNALKKQEYQVHGFIETNQQTKKNIDGVPVFSWNELHKDAFNAQLLIGIFNRNSALNDLKKIAQLAGFKKILMPWDFYGELSSELGWQYWLSCPNVILKNLTKIKIVYDLLSDNESKNTLLKICEFRLGIADFYASFKHNENQYFNNLTLQRFSEKDECVYVDCGAYNGDTFVEAQKRIPVTIAYLFEPDLCNFRKLVAGVAKFKGLTVCLPLAVSNESKILEFDGESEAGAIVREGKIKVAAAALDEILPNTTVDFIKYDVEGSEIPGLEGAKNLIARSKPTLALSLYHRPEDLWEIPILIYSYCNDYQFYIRQHYKNSFDSVLYAIPYDIK